MNYIIFDLEWNQSANGKQYSLDDMPFEIIEIGSVKLDEHFQITDSFEKIIKPQVYMELHYAVRDMLHLDRHELMEGESFKSAATDFFAWCGKDPVFCTWGSLDLVELQRNVKHFGVDYTFKKPLLYYDVQKLFSIQFQDGRQRLSLEHAVNMLDMKEDSGYHRAINDAEYTADLFKKLDMNLIGKFFSIDTYNIPSTRGAEVYLNFGNYGKYVSIGFPTREDAMSD